MHICTTRPQAGLGGWLQLYLSPLLWSHANVTGLIQLWKNPPARPKKTPTNSTHNQSTASMSHWPEAFPWQRQGTQRHLVWLQRPYRPVGLGRISDLNRELTGRQSLTISISLRDQTLTSLPQDVWTSNSIWATRRSGLYIQCLQPV